MNKDIIFFDLEATHKYWNYASILQIAYLRLDSDLKIKKVYNQYVMPEGEVPAASVAIHGLTRNKLQFLSMGTTMEDIADDIYKEFSDPNVIIAGYNCNTYDIPLLQRELVNLGCEPLNIPQDRVLDLLPIMRKKLVNLVSKKLSSSSAYVISSYGIKLADLNDTFTELTGSDNVDFHGALYDSFMTMVLHVLTKDYETL